MKRLRDSEPATPLLEKAQALIDSVDPLPESRERMARVRREIDRPRGVLAGLRRLPALALAGLIALFGASAFAAVRYIASKPAANQLGAESAGAGAPRPGHRGGHHEVQRHCDARDAGTGPHPGPHPTIRIRFRIRFRIRSGIRNCAQAPRDRAARRGACARQRQRARASRAQGAATRR